MANCRTRNVEFTAAPLDDVVSRYSAGIAALAEGLEDALSATALAALRARADALCAQGTPSELARRIAALPILLAGPDVVLVAARTGHPIAEIAATHFAVDDAFRLGALAEAARSVEVTDYFDRLALDRAVDGIAAAHRRLTAEVVAHGGHGSDAVAAWSAARGADVTRIRSGVESIVASGLTLSKLTVAASLLGDLARE
jgi:glutamate dehydrogenase